MYRKLGYYFFGFVFSLLFIVSAKAELIYEYDAGRDPANANSTDNLRWEPNVNFSALNGSQLNRDFQLNQNNAANTGVLYNSSPSTSLPGITGSYTFDGNLNFAARTGTGSSNSFGRDGLPLGGTNNNDAGASSTFEAWIRPNAATLDAIGSSKIIESGGSTSGMHLDFVGTSGGVDLRFRTRQGNNNSEAVLSLTDNDLLSDYMHIVGVVDPASSTEKLRLYVNGGTLADGFKSSANSFKDWQDGNSDAALGGVNTGGAGGAQGTSNNYNGDFAIFRLYDNPMTDAQVQSLYNEIQRETVFHSSFEYSGGDPTVGTDAANLNGADGQIGTFMGTIPVGAGGDFAPELIGFSANPQEGTSANRGQLAFIDRPSTDGSFTASLAETIELTDAMVSLDLGTRRTQGNHDKDYSVVGLDSAGNEAFNLLVSTHSGTSTERERLAVITDGGATTTYDLIGTFGGVGTDANGDMPNIGAPGFGEEDIANIILNLSEEDYTISFTRDDLAYVTGAIPYNSDLVSDLAAIDFRFLGGGSDAARAGFILDNLIVEGFLPPVVPEPSTFALAALGLLGLVAYVRRRR